MEASGQPCHKIMDDEVDGPEAQSQPLGVDQEHNETSHHSIPRASSQPFLVGSSGTKKHHSSPAPYSSCSSVSSSILLEFHTTRDRFEKRHKFSNSRQDSIDLSFDLNTTCEDVFDEGGNRQGQSQRGRMALAFQRSFSVPATLPDVVQQASSSFANSSPDVLMKEDTTDSGACDLSTVNSSSKTSIIKHGPEDEDAEARSTPVDESTSDASPTVEGFIKSTEFTVTGCEEENIESHPGADQNRCPSHGQIFKQRFEGATCYSPEDCSKWLLQTDASKPNQKRRKSVSFDTAAENVRVFSAHGMKARSHFRSSGYGSQSESSQHSQKSDTASCQESVMSDDVLLERHQSTLSSVERSSFETGFGGSLEQDSAGMEPETSPPYIDGSIDGRDSDTKKKKGSKGSESSETSYSNTLSGSSLSNYGAVGGATEQFTASAPYGSQTFEVGPYCDSHNVPALSIFNEPNIRETSGGSVGCSDVAWGNFSDLRNQVLEQSEGSEGCEMLAPISQLPFQQVLPSSDPVGTFNTQNSRQSDTPSPSERFSPTSAQRELYEKIIEDKMANFDPTSGESLSDLFDWIRTNLPAEALSPSPRSPFFPPDGSPQNMKNAQTLANILGLAAADVNKLMPLPPAGVDGVLRSPACPRPHAASARSAVNDQSQQLLEPSREQPVLPTVQQPQNQLPTVLAEAVPLSSMSRQPDSSVVLSESSLGTGVNESYLEQVSKFSQCTYSECTDRECLQWRSRVQSLRDATRRGESLSEDDQKTLKVLCGHYKYCDYPACLVPWCRRICRLQHESRTPQAVVSILTSPMLTLLPPDFEVTNFVKLSSEWPFSRMPQEWEHWLPLSPLSHSQSVVRAIPLVASASGKHWALKLTALHEGENQLEVLGALSNLQHPNLVPHHWLATDRCNEILLVCTEYQTGVTLKELLNGRTRLSNLQVQKYLLQILSAVQHLHSLNIVYLNWSSANILLDPTCQRVKMMNFTSSVHLPGDYADIGSIKLSLPADVVPPELLVEGGDILFNTDSWGLACLLHEMLAGWRPWHTLRHDRQEDVWRNVKRQVRPKLAGDIPPSMQLLLNNCFKRCPKERLSAEQILHRVQRE